MEYGLTPDTLCDPEISAESMEKIRYSLMDQQSVFEDAKEEIKKKRTQRISLTIFIMVFAFIVSVVYLMNKDTIDKYIEPVLLELTTDRVTVEYGEGIHFMDYVKYYDKSQQLTIPLNEKLKKVWKNTVLLSMWKSALASGTFVFGKILFEPDIILRQAKNNRKPKWLPVM